jgi:hypothetical protein
MDIADHPEGRVGEPRDGPVQEIEARTARPFVAVARLQEPQIILVRQRRRSDESDRVDADRALSIVTSGVRAQDYRAYQIYDFVPGNRIIFEDDFRNTQDGELAARWKLLGGQAGGEQGRRRTGAAADRGELREG